MKKWLITGVYIIIHFFCQSASCAQKTEATINIRANITPNTCTLKLTPSSINFGTVRIEEIDAGSIASQTVKLDMECVWPATGVSIKFVPMAGVSSFSNNLMKTGHSGVGLALSWRKQGASDFTSLDYNSSLSLTQNSQTANGNLGEFSLFPKRLPEENIESGSMSTNLSVEVNYD